MAKTVEAVHTHTHTQYCLYKGKLYTAVPLFIMEFVYSTAYSREISFICCAQNIVLAVNRKIDLIDNIKDGLCSNIKVVM